MTFADLPRGGEDPRRDADGAVAAQFCTSGTTGLPKGAMLTGWNLLNIGSCLAMEMPEMREGGRSLVCHAACSTSAAPAGRSGACRTA